MKLHRRLGPLAACVLALGACASQTTPARTPSQAAEVSRPPAAPAPCGTVTGPHGAAQVVIRGNAVACDEARTLLAQYFAHLTPADLASTDGAGPVALGPWTCGSDPGEPLSATCSTEDDRQIASSPA